MPLRKMATTGNAYNADAFDPFPPRLYLLAYKVDQRRGDAWWLQRFIQHLCLATFSPGEM
jgi:hypothetical protein